MDQPQPKKKSKIKKLNPTYFEQVINEMPQIELQIKDSIVDSVQRHISIKGRGINKEEAINLFDHALGMLPEAKKRMGIVEERK